MKKNYDRNPIEAQTMIEYLLILTVVAIVAFASFAPGGLLDKGRESSKGFFEAMSEGIMGNTVDPLTTSNPPPP